MGVSAKTGARERVILALSRWGSSFPWKNVDFEDNWLGDPHQGQKIFNGQFEFFSEELNALEHLFWRHPGSCEVFRARLHGFEWLKDLRALPIPQARGVARRYISDWIEANQTWHPTVWSQEVTGARVCAWVGLFNFFGSSADADFLSVFQKSMSQHMRYLSLMRRCSKPDQLSLCVFKGLIFSRIAMGLPLGAYVEYLGQYLNHFFYADGSCEYRTPIAQLQVLRDLLDIKHILKKASVNLPQGFQSHVDRLAMVIRFFRHGDGGLALFHKSLEGKSDEIDTVLSQTSAKGDRVQCLEESGFYRASEGKGLLIFDTGSPLVSQTLHEDRLGFEYSYGALRLITNGTHPLHAIQGVHEGAETSFLSGTALFFNKENRVMVSPLENTGCDVSVWTLMDDGCSVMTSEWDQRISGVRFHHHRSLTLMNAGHELRGQERLMGNPHGMVLLRLTFHPKLRAIFRKDSAHIILTSPEGQKWCLRADTNVDLSLHRGYYYGMDNKEVFCPQALMKIRLNDKPTMVKWTFRLLDTLS